MERATVVSEETEAAPREIPVARLAPSNARIPENASVGSSFATDGRTAATARTNDARCERKGRNALYKRSDVVGATFACRER